MKVSQTEQGQRQAALTIELEPGDLEPFLDRGYRGLVRRLAIPGFRRGKAPRHIVERLVGREAMLREVLEDLVAEVSQKAVQVQELVTSGVPEVELVGWDPLTLRATVPLAAGMELGDYRSLRIPPEPVVVPEAEVEGTLERLRRDAAPWEPVQHPVQMDDLVTVDVKGLVGQRTVLNSTAVDYLLVAELPVPAPGFAEQLVGMEKDSTREFTLSFPSDYPDAALAKKSCAFTVMVREVKSRKLPALDDEFAKSVGQGYESLEALQKEVRARLQAEAERVAQEEYQEKVLKQLLEQATVELPELLVERETAHLLENHQRAMERRLADPELRAEDYLKNVGKAPEQIREEAQAAAIKGLTRSFVLQKVAELEEITVSPEEVDQELQTLGPAVEGSLRGQAVHRFLQSDRGRESLARAFLNRKTLQRLAEIARGDVPQVAATAEAQGGEDEATT